MKRLLVAGVALVLSACATTPHLDVCKGAQLRRTAYTTTIAAADAWPATGRVAPFEVLLARSAAVTALAVLNSNCPTA